MKLKTVKAKDLIMNPDNPRIMSDFMFERLGKSMSKYGYVIPISVDEKNRVLSGHQRLTKILEVEGEDCELQVLECNIPEKDALKLLIEVNKHKGWFDYIKLVGLTDKFKLDVSFTDIELENIKNHHLDLSVLDVGIVECELDRDQYIDILESRDEFKLVIKKL
jgi:hypothetical protein